MASPTTAAPGLNPEAEEFLLPHEIPNLHPDDHLALSFPLDFPESPEPIRFCPPQPPHPFLPSPLFAPVIPLYYPDGNYWGLYPLISSPFVSPPLCVLFDRVECVSLENRTPPKKRPQKKAFVKKITTAQIRRRIKAIGAENQPPRLQWRPKSENQAEIEGKGDSFTKRSNSVPASAPLKIYNPTPRRCSSVPATDGFLKRRPNRATGKPRLPLIALTPEERKTTVMIRNIPNRYTREMLKKFLINHCKTQNKEKGELKSPAVPLSAFDFLYVPIDFESGYNQGYAFVNFTSHEAAWTFLQSQNLQNWDRFHSNKIRQICRAQLQGKEALIKKFDDVKFPEEEYQPQVYEPGHDGFTKVEETSIGKCTKKRTFRLK